MESKSSTANSPSNRRTAGFMGIFADPFFLVPFALLAQIALASPDRVLDSLGSIGNLVWSTATAVPPISTYVAVSSFPQVTALFLSSLLCLLPFQVYGLSRRIYAREQDAWQAHWKVNPKMQRWGGLIIALLLVFCLVGFVFVGRDPSFCRGCTSDSRIGLLMVSGFAAPYLLGFLIAGEYAWIKHRLFEGKTL